MSLNILSSCDPSQKPELGFVSTSLLITFFSVTFCLEYTTPSGKRMRYYEPRYPEVDELVMVQVRQIAEMGAYVKLVRPTLFHIHSDPANQISSVTVTSSNMTTSKE